MFGVNLSKLMLVGVTLAIVLLASLGCARRSSQTIIVSDVTRFYDLETFISDPEIYHNLRFIR